MIPQGRGDFHRGIFAAEAVWLLTEAVLSDIIAKLSTEYADVLELVDWLA